MPLIVAAIVYGGAFFGYMGHSLAHDEIVKANQAQMEWLRQKEKNIAIVAIETLKTQEVK